MSWTVAYWLFCAAAVGGVIGGMIGFWRGVLSGQRDAEQCWSEIVEKTDWDRAR